MSKKIVILFGGPSFESEISNLSANRIYNALKDMNYNVTMIEYEKNIFGRLKTFDICFNAMHGSPGEDGSVQGMLESIQLPYTGSGVIPSAITINKFYTQTILKSYNIPIAKSIYIDRDTIKNDKDAIKRIFDKNIIIKPNTGGSSVGTIIVSPDKAYNEIINSIDKFKEFIIEEYIDNAIEITVGIIEYDNKIIVLTPLQLNAKNQFYDFEAKYTKGMTQFIIPAQINDTIMKKVKYMARDIYKKLHLHSFARIDFLIKDGNIYELEVNTIPGMTELSDLPYEAKYDGIDYNTLIEKIIKTAGLNRNA